MTAREIMQNADKGNIANGDFDKPAVLYRQIIPEFMDRVGRVAWSTKYDTVTTSVGTRDYALPADFRRMLTVIPDSSPRDALPYYGEDQKQVLLLDSSTEQRKPSGYMIIRNSDSELKSLRFDYTPDAAYLFRYSYEWELDEKNSGVDVQIDEYIPKRHQWALVLGLRREIYLDRFDQNDNRYIAEAQRFDEAVARVSSTSNREQARRGRYGVYAS